MTSKEAMLDAVGRILVSAIGLFAIGAAVVSALVFGTWLLGKADDR